MEALPLEAGGAIFATDLKVDVERRGGLNICPFCGVCVCVCVVFTLETAYVFNCSVFHFLCNHLFANLLYLLMPCCNV